MVQKYIVDEFKRASRSVLRRNVALTAVFSIPAIFSAPALAYGFLTDAPTTTAHVLGQVVSVVIGARALFCFKDALQTASHANAPIQKLLESDHPGDSSAFEMADRKLKRLFRVPQPVKHEVSHRQPRPGDFNEPLLITVPAHLDAVGRQIIDRKIARYIPR